MSSGSRIGKLDSVIRRSFWFCKRKLGLFISQLHCMPLLKFDISISDSFWIFSNVWYDIQVQIYFCIDDCPVFPKSCIEWAIFSLPNLMSKHFHKFKYYICMCICICICISIFVMFYSTGLLIHYLESILEALYFILIVGAIYLIVLSLKMLLGHLCLSVFHMISRITCLVQKIIF